MRNIQNFDLSELSPYDSISSYDIKGIDFRMKDLKNKKPKSNITKRKEIDFESKDQEFF